MNESPNTTLELTFGSWIVCFHWNVTRRLPNAAQFLRWAARPHHTMKTILLSFAVLLICAQFVLGADRQLKVGEGSEHPKDGFASADALTHWAGTSSFGGGSVQSSKLGDRAVYVVTRSFTSGMATTEVSVYADKADGKGVYRALFQPTRLVELRTRFADDSIIIEQYDQRTRKWVVCMTVTKYFFHDDTTHLKR